MKFIEIALILILLSISMSILNQQFCMEYDSDNICIERSGLFGNILDNQSWSGPIAPSFETGYTFPSSDMYAGNDSSNASSMTSQIQGFVQDTQFTEQGGSGGVLGGISDAMNQAAEWLRSVYQFIELIGGAIFGLDDMLKAFKIDQSQDNMEFIAFLIKLPIWLIYALAVFQIVSNRNLKGMQ